MTPTNQGNKLPANGDRLEETFRREGNTEILELSHSTLEDSINGDESGGRTRSRQVDIQISISIYILAHKFNCN